MYCNYFGFREKPFNITPNPRFLYLSKQHKEAFAHLLYGIRNHAGFIKLTGEVGTGKTTLLRTILGELDDSTYRSALILNPCLSALELLRNINREFSIPHDGLENGALLEELNRFLLTENRAGKTVVLVIDESQNLAPQVLEQIRLISNLETESDKLIQIVLAGQPELNTLLAQSELRQLAQRITVHFHLLPMDFDDSANYIRHRIQVAGGGGWISFADNALKKIYRFAKGSPRLLNIACDRSLLIAYTGETGSITGSIAAEAIAELADNKSSSFSRRKLFSVAMLVILLTAAVLAGLRLQQKKDESAPPLPTLSAPPATTAPMADIPEDLWQKLPSSRYPAVRKVLLLWGKTGLEQTGPDGTIAWTATHYGFSTIRPKSLEQLLTLDTPAVIEIWRRQGGKSRKIAITAAENGNFLIGTDAGEKLLISKAGLASLWTGRGEIIWENRINVKTGPTGNVSANSVKQLQEILLKAGRVKGEPTGIFDEATHQALRQIQTEAGLPVNGLLDEPTLLVVNREFGHPAPPRLQKRQKRGV